MCVLSGWRRKVDLGVEQRSTWPPEFDGSCNIFALFEKITNMGQYRSSVGDLKCFARTFSDSLGVTGNEWSKLETVSSILCVQSAGVGVPL